MERIEGCINFLLGKAYQQVNQETRRRLTPFGVTPVQFAVLHVLWERGEHTASELGERLRLDSATMTGVLDRIEQAGLVERRPDTRDRRVNRVALTPRGCELREPLDRLMDEINAEILGRFSAADAAHLTAMLIELGQRSSRAG